MPPYTMNVLVDSAQSHLAQFSSFVMSGQTVIIGMIHFPSFDVWPELTCVRTVLFFVGAGTVFRLVHHQWAAAAFPTEDDDRALLSRSRVRPASRIAFPVAGVNSGRVYHSCPTAAPPKAPALSPRL